MSESGNDSLASYATTSEVQTTESESEHEFYVANSFVIAYEDEPIALPGENERNAQEQDVDGLVAATLDGRFERTIPLSVWCKCGKCSDEMLVGAREFRCCREVGPTIRILTFDGSIERISCVTDHEDYIDLTKRVVLENVGPLLRDKNNRPYKRRGGQSINEYLRAVAYMWIVRWMCGYLGWENTRPLPACVYHKVRTKFVVNQAHGFSSSIERA